jgi:hypothetical protein
VGPSIATDVKAEGSRSAAAWVDELNRERVDEEAERVVETRSHPKMRRLRKIYGCPRAGNGDKITQPGRRVVGESLVQSPTRWPANQS